MTRHNFTPKGRREAPDRIKTHMSKENEALCNNTPSAYEPNRLTLERSLVTCNKCLRMLEAR